MSVALITGAGGFLGNAIARTFADRQWTVVGLGRTNKRSRHSAEHHRMTLPDPRLGMLLRHCRPDVVVHCAGCTSVPESFHKPERDFSAGPPVMFELLDHVRRASPQARVVFLSSAAVYGNPRSLPIREQHLPRPVSPYGFHKRMCEVLCEQFTRCFDVATVIARIFSAYGPGLHRQVIWDICEKALGGREVVLQGTGEETRDFIHVDDAAEAVFLLATTRRCAGKTYNLASGAEMKIADLAAKIVGQVAPGTPVHFAGNSPPGMPRRWRADVRRLEALGFRATTDIDGLLGDTVAHHQREIAARCLRKSA